MSDGGRLGTQKPYTQAEYEQMTDAGRMFCPATYAQTDWEGEAHGYEWMRLRLFATIKHLLEQGGKLP